MSTKNSDNVFVNSRNGAPTSNPYELLETIGERNFKAALQAEFGTPLAIYDAICLSGAETGECNGDATGINSAKWVEATTTHGETVQLRQIKFKIIEGAGSLSPSGWTSQLLSPADSIISSYEQNLYLTLHPWAYSENAETANKPIRNGDVIKVYKVGGCYFYRSVTSRGIQSGIEPFINSSLNGEIDKTMDAFGKSDGGPNNTLGGSNISAKKEQNDRATSLFEAALKAEFSKQGLKFHVTSRRRQVRNQAKLIIQKWDKHGESEVKRSYSEEVYRALKRMKDAPENSPQRANATTAFLNAVRGSSDHLDGLAIDIRTKWYSSEQMKKALKAVQTVGANPYLEPTKRKTPRCWEDPGSNPSHIRLSETPGKNECYAEHIHCKTPTKFIEAAKAQLSIESLSEVSW